MTSQDAQAPCAGSSGDPAGQPLLSTDVLVHIGLIKTGSTWLQEHLLGRGDTGFWSPGDIAMAPKARVKAHTYALYRDDLGRLLPDEDFNPADLREQLESFVVPVGRCAVFSNERLGGHPLSNGIDRGQICNRIKQVFPNARILIVIREQRSMILSNYMQHLKYGGGYTLRTYLDGKSDAKCPALTFHHFKYDRLIRQYQSVFGPENVLALPFEMMSVNPQSFIERICQFSNTTAPEGLPFHIKSNERTNYFSYIVLRRIVPLIRSSRGNAYSPTILGRKLGKAVHLRMVDAIGKIVPRSLDKKAKERLQQQVEELTKDTYVTSNRETEKLIGMDLGPFGYLV